LARIAAEARMGSDRLNDKADEFVSTPLVDDPGNRLLIKISYRNLCFAEVYEVAFDCGYLADGYQE
jgi:hypothetical protein